MPSQSDQILELIAVAGEFPTAALRRLPIKESYRYKLMADLKEKKLIRLYTRDGLRGYRITAKARDSLMTFRPERFEFFLTGNAETNKRLTDYKRRLRLHHTAEVAVTLSNIGIAFYPDEKPTLFSETLQAASKPSEVAFYFSREMKNIGLEHLKIRSSRAAGVLLAENEMLLTYNSGNNLMRWEYQTEIRCKALLSARFCKDVATSIYSDADVNGLMLGTGMDMALPLLTSTGGYRRQYFRLDGTFERFYFAPNTPEGESQIRILCSDSVKSALNNLLLSDLVPKEPGLRVDHDALSNDGIPILFAFEFDMERLRRFHDSLELFGETGMVYCFDFQKPVLEKYLGTLAGIQTIDLEKVERRFFST